VLLLTEIHCDHFTITKGPVCNTVSGFGYGIHQKSTPEYRHIKNICKFRSFIVMFSMFSNIVFSALISNCNIVFTCLTCEEKLKNACEKLMTTPYRSISSFQSVFICLSKMHIANLFSTSTFLSTASQKKRTELADSSFHSQILQYCKFLFAYRTMIFSNFIALEYLFLKSAVYFSKYTFCVFSVAHNCSNLQFGTAVFQTKKKFASSDSAVSQLQLL